jgi:hypothetical protein
MRSHTALRSTRPETNTVDELELQLGTRAT